MVYICPGGNCTGIAIFFDKVSHLKHPNEDAWYDQKEDKYKDRDKDIENDLVT